MADEQNSKKAQGARPDRVRLVVLLYRKKGLSVEEFQASWRDDFAPIMSGIPIFKKNLLTYEQIAIYEALSYGKIFECLNDEEFRKVIAPEEEKLLDESRSLAFPVDIVPIFDDVRISEAIPSSSFLQWVSRHASGVKHSFAL
ncbi:MAG: hypothetical protein ASARMPRED_006804 [Alectoria sarmentosa]|nr:MAG: hypothetical protein ASARMPRED_006804 [Alectoria sarmentosa]